MENLKAMVDVNTILGDPVETPDGTVIIPVSRVSFGFAAGGSEFSSGNNSDSELNDTAELPFGGGSGGGISLNPVAFLVVSQDQVRLIPVDSNQVYDRIIDMVPKVVDQLQGVFKPSNGGLTQQNSFDI